VTAAKAKTPRASLSRKRRLSFAADPTRAEPAGWVYRSAADPEAPPGSVPVKKRETPSPTAPGLPPRQAGRAAPQRDRAGKATVKKTSNKKSAARKTAVTKTAAKKTAAKKTAAKKTAVKKTVASRPVAKPVAAKPTAATPPAAPPARARTGGLDWITAPIAYAVVGALALFSGPRARSRSGD
jgi:hypothetical protein